MLHGDSKKHGDDHVYLWLIITHEILYIFMLGLGTSPIISTLLSLENWKASPAIAILTFYPVWEVLYTWWVSKTAPNYILTSVIFDRLFLFTYSWKARKWVPYSNPCSFQAWDIIYHRYNISMRYWVWKAYETQLKSAMWKGAESYTNVLF